MESDPNFPLLVIKRAPSEGEHGKPLPTINAFIETQLRRLEGAMPELREDVDHAVLDRLLMGTVMAEGAWASAAQGREI